MDVGCFVVRGGWRQNGNADAGVGTAHVEEAAGNIRTGTIKEEVKLKLTLAPQSRSDS